MHPVLFTLPMPWGPQPIFAYGLALGIALVVGFQLVARRGRREGLSEQVLTNAYLAAVVCGVLGARLWYVAVNHEQVQSSGQSVLDITAGGVSTYGGLLGGLLGAALYLRRKRTSLLRVGDAAAPAVALGIAITRLGCYLHGCGFGAVLPEGAPAALKRLGTFPRWELDSIGVDGAPAFWHHFDRYGLSRDAAASFPVHPTQLYELVGALVLFALCAGVVSRRRFEGQALLSLGFGYGLLRFLVEYVRDDPTRGQLLGFSSPQLISLVVIAGCAVGYSLLRRRAVTAGARVPRAPAA